MPSGFAAAQFAVAKPNPARFSSADHAKRLPHRRCRSGCRTAGAEGGCRIAGAEGGCPTAGAEAAAAPQVPKAAAAPQVPKAAAPPQVAGGYLPA